MLRTMPLAFSTIRQAVHEWAGSEPRVRRVYLYCSRARSEEREDSDVDLGVMLTWSEAGWLLDWMDNADRWRADLARLPAPVHLELARRSMATVWRGLKRSRVCLYRRYP